MIQRFHTWFEWKTSVSGGIRTWSGCKTLPGKRLQSIPPGNTFEDAFTWLFLECFSNN